VRLDGGKRDEPYGSLRVMLERKLVCILSADRQWIDFARTFVSRCDPVDARRPSRVLCS